LEDFVTSGMAADHKATMSKGNRVSIQMLGTNNELEFGGGKLLLHLHNIVRRIILFDHVK